MNIHDFMLTLICSLIAGALLGYFLRELITGLGQFFHRHLEPRHLRRYRSDTGYTEEATAKDHTDK